MGIRQAIVAINKMDLFNYAQAVFLEIKEKIQKFLDQIGFDDIRYVCYSGITGQNLVNKYEDDDDLLKINKINKVNRMPWHKGNTFLEELEQLRQPVRLINKPLRISIFDYQKISGIGWILIGLIKTGILKKNMTICLPLNFWYNKKQYFCIKCKCFSIEKHCKDLDMAFPGDIVGIKIKGFFNYLDRQNFKNISLIKNDEEQVSKNILNFTAIIHVMNVPNSIKVGFCPILFFHTKHIKVKFSKLLYKIDGRTNKIIEKNPIEIINGERAVVLFELGIDLFQSNECFNFEKYTENPFFGSFILRDNNKIIQFEKFKK